jgi:CRP/FNR family cyclic AMP-dependent transcriptional regulator
MPAVAEVDLEGLRKVTVFSVLTPEQLGTLAEAAQVTEHGEGEYLTQEGIFGHRFHLLLEGGAVVERGGTEIARIGPGDFVGEIGLLGGGASTASVRCTVPIRCLTLRREAFWEALEQEPSIALRILEVVCRRLERELRPSPQANLAESTG